MFGTVKFHPMYYDASERLNSTPKWNFGLQMTFSNLDKCIMLTSERKESIIELLSVAFFALLINLLVRQTGHE